MTDVAPASKDVNVREEENKMLLVAINDNSGGLKLQVWNNQLNDVENGGSYVITDVSDASCQRRSATYEKTIEHNRRTTESSTP